MIQFKAMANERGNNGFTELETCSALVDTQVREWETNLTPFPFDVLAEKVFFPKAGILFTETIKY